MCSTSISTPESWLCEPFKSWSVEITVNRCPPCRSTSGRARAGAAEYHDNQSAVWQGISSRGLARSHPGDDPTAFDPEIFAQHDADRLAVDAVFLGQNPRR